MCAAQVFNLFGLHEAVLRLSFSPDERFLAASGAGGTQALWDMETGEQAYAKKLADDTTFFAWGPVRDAGAGRRPRYTLCYGAGTSVIVADLVYDVRSLRYVLSSAPCRVTTGLVRAHHCGWVDASGEYLIAGTPAGEFNVFNITTRVYRATVPAVGNGLLALAPLPDGSLVVGGGDGAVRHFGGRDGAWTCRGETRLQVAARMAICVSVCGLMHIRIPARAAQGRVVALSLSAEGTWLLAGTDAGIVYRVSLAAAADGGPRTALHASVLSMSHVGPVLGVSFGAGRADAFSTCSRDGTVRVWDLSEYVATASASGPCAALCVW